jgi:peptidoglycan/xylan/chitin deacetylase (PgdA/CDA1 family)
MANNVPLSLAIIAKVFGSDRELVDTVKTALRSGFEATVHGWEHENLTVLTLTEQEQRLRLARQALKEMLNVDANVLVPPMFCYNNDTLRAMHLAGYEVISGLAELQQKGPLSDGILSIPATVELSDFANGTWKMKSVQTVINELNSSIQLQGYAIILSHPQEFMKDGKLNQDAVTIYSDLLRNIGSTYSFAVLETLKQYVTSSSRQTSGIVCTVSVLSDHSIAIDFDPIGNITVSS